MKPLNLLILLLLLAGCSKKDDPQPRKREPHNEIPDAIIPSKPCSTLYKSIMDMFYEHVDNKALHPELFADGAQKKILITQESEVYVSFISEGAGFANTLGWYSYDASAGPGKSANLQLNLIFPHVSNTVLQKGDMVQLGTEKFKPGTVIGFFLIIRGWEDGFVNFSKPTHFTDYQFNINEYQQHILFKEGQCGDIVMAFEDKPLDSGSDYDFNDVIFTIADNKAQLETVSFDMSSMVRYEGTAQ